MSDSHEHIISNIDTLKLTEARILTAGLSGIEPRTFIIYKLLY